MACSCCMLLVRRGKQRRDYKLEHKVEQGEENLPGNARRPVLTIHVIPEGRYFRKRVNQIPSAALFYLKPANPGHPETHFLRTRS